MQLRDSRPDIWYPGHWGLFGGAIEAAEDPVMGLRRELEEELELVPENPELFTSIDFDLTSIGLRKYRRSFYVVSISQAQLAKLVLHEGAGMRVFEGAKILAEARVVPYDSFALYLHCERARLA